MQRNIPSNTFDGVKLFQQAITSNITAGTLCYSNSAANCTIIQSAAALYGDPLCASISIVGVFLNVLVVLVIRESMNRRRTAAQIHLVALAISDITVGASAFSAAILSWSCNFCRLPCENAKFCFMSYALAILFQDFFLILNRSMTLYISFVRAKSLMSVTEAIATGKKSQRRVIIELGLKVTILTVAHFCLLVLPNFILYHRKIAGPNNAMAWCRIFSFGIYAITEIIIATLILITLRYRRRSPDGNASPVDDDFAKLVGLVAFVFSGTAVLGIFEGVAALQAVNDFESMHGSRRYWLIFFNLVNSSINIVIYLIASRNFRHAFRRFCNKIICSP